MKLTSKPLLAGMLAATLSLSAWADAPAADAAVQPARDKFFSTWEAHGSFFAVEPQKLLFQGIYEGMMFTEDGGGLMDGAEVICAVTQEIHLNNAPTQAAGRCSITVSDEDTIYARFNCDGQPGMCDGEFTLVGGTGIFSKISGGGLYRSRTQLGELAGQLGSNAVVGSAEGFAVWSAVKYCME